MPLPYHILFYLENDSFILTEIKRLDLAPDEEDPGKLFYWLLFYNSTEVLRKLEFVAMDSQPDAQEREFQQGRLRFTPQAGIYQSYATGQTLALQVRRPDVLPPALADAVMAYLPTQ